MTPKKYNYLSKRASRSDWFGNMSSLQIWAFVWDEYEDIINTSPPLMDGRWGISVSLILEINAAGWRGPATGLWQVDQQMSSALFYQAESNSENYWDSVKTCPAHLHARVVIISIRISPQASLDALNAVAQPNSALSSDRHVSVFMCMPWLV